MSVEWYIVQYGKTLYCSTGFTLLHLWTDAAVGVLAKLHSYALHASSCSIQAQVRKCKWEEGSICDGVNDSASETRSVTLP